MAAGYCTIYLSSGDTLSLYSDATTIGSNLRCNLAGAAGATSPLEFMVKSNCCIIDIIATQTAGEIEFLNNAMRTNKKIGLVGQWIGANDRRSMLPRICFRPGVRYSVVATVQTS